MKTDKKHRVSGYIWASLKLYPNATEIDDSDFTKFSFLGKIVCTQKVSYIRMLS